MHQHHEALKTLKNAEGQIRAAINMTEEHRNCMDISHQISATIALLKRAQKKILTDHLHSCVAQSIEMNDSKAKLEEIDLLIKSLI